MTTHSTLPVELLKQPVVAGMVHLWLEQHARGPIHKPTRILDDSRVLWDAVQERVPGTVPCYVPFSGGQSLKLLHWLVLDRLQVVIRSTHSIDCAFTLPELLSYRTIARYLVHPSEFNLRALRSEGRLTNLVDAFIFCREYNYTATDSVLSILSRGIGSEETAWRFHHSAQMYVQLEPWLPSVRTMVKYLYPTTTQWNELDSQLESE